MALVTEAALFRGKGEADIVIAGGAEAAVTEMGIRGFIACRALSDAHKGTVDVRGAASLCNPPELHSPH